MSRSDATLSAVSNTFQGKLDLINAFSDETEALVASLLREDLQHGELDPDQGRHKFDLNGTAITISATVASTVCRD